MTTWMSPSVQRSGTNDVRWKFASILCVVFASGLGALVINISNALALLLLSISVYCLLFWISPKKMMLAFGVFLCFQGLVKHFLSGGAFSMAVANLHTGLTLITFTMTIMRRMAFGLKLRLSVASKLLFVITFVGFLSSYLCRYQPPTVVLISYFLLIKGFMAFYSFANIDFDASDLKMVLNTFLTVSGISLVGAIANIIIPDYFIALVGGVKVYRMGILSLSSIFGHPGALGTFMGIAACFAFAFYTVTTRKVFLALFLLFFATTLSSLRITASVGIMLALVLAVAVIPNKEKRRFAGFLILVGTAIMVPVSHKALQLGHHVISGYVNVGDPYKVARNALYLCGKKIAGDYFPLGSGLGTFGSWMSRVNYSPLYYKYHLNNVWGLSPATGQFINDTFWPHILAELGVIGCLAYMLIIATFFKITVRAVKTLQNDTSSAFALGTFMMLVLSLVESLKYTIYEQSLWTFIVFGGVGITVSLLANQERQSLATSEYNISCG